MDALVIKVVGTAILVGVLQTLLHNRDFITFLNTTLNAASWVLLIRAQRSLRKEVTPKLEHVEQQVGTVVDRVTGATPSAITGGRRDYDPPRDNGEDPR